MSSPRTTEPSTPCVFIFSNFSRRTFVMRSGVISSGIFVPLEALQLVEVATLNSLSSLEICQTKDIILLSTMRIDDLVSTLDRSLCELEEEIHNAILRNVRVCIFRFLEIETRYLEYLVKFPADSKLARRFHFLKICFQILDKYVENIDTTLNESKDLGTSETETTENRNGLVESQITRTNNGDIEKAEVPTVQTAKKQIAVEAVLPTINIYYASRGNVQQMPEPDTILTDNVNTSDWEETARKVATEHLKCRSDSAEKPTPMSKNTELAVGANDGCPDVPIAELFTTAAEKIETALLTNENDDIVKQEVCTRAKEEKCEDSTKWNTRENKGAVVAPPFKLLELTIESEEVSTSEEVAKKLTNKYYKKKIFTANFFRSMNMEVKNTKRKRKALIRKWIPHVFHRWKMESCCNWLLNVVGAIT